jgi:hypothetical protein
LKIYTADFPEYWDDRLKTKQTRERWTPILSGGAVLISFYLLDSAGYNEKNKAERLFQRLRRAGGSKEKINDEKTSV